MISTVTFFGIFVLHEHLHVYDVIAAILIMLGLFLITMH